tara:strand:+ start:42 stop:272 length:231 start_codon:yes stop_codon:yes gene_type:complete
MLDNLEDIKLFIQWCKSNKVKSFKTDNVQFELSELGFVENIADYTEELQTPLDESKFEDDQQKQDDDELMFWSSST